MTAELLVPGHRKSALATVGTRSEVFQKRKAAPLAIDTYSSEKLERIIVPDRLPWTRTWNSCTLASQGSLVANGCHRDGSMALNTTMWQSTEYSPKSLR
mmetsp:Transcript_25425/g.49787  ORF Transcript_25425/g.49787 Transcript_25425/m.49787 type:complete len:99 (+) Transcript_25425:83-379(+)